MKHDPAIFGAHRSSIHLLSFSLGYLFAQPALSELPEEMRACWERLLGGVS